MNKFGSVSFILGIISFVLGYGIIPLTVKYGQTERWIVAVIIVGVILGNGLILGIIGTKKDEENAFSIAGIVVCTLSLFMTWVPLLYMLLVNELGMW